MYSSWVLCPLISWATLPLFGRGDALPGPECIKVPCTLPGRPYFMRFCLENCAGAELMRKKTCTSASPFPGLIIFQQLSHLKCMSCIVTSSVSRERRNFRRDGVLLFMAKYQRSVGVWGYVCPKNNKNSGFRELQTSYSLVIGV